MSGNEMFYRDAKGKKQDASLHDTMLDNPEAEALASRLAIKAAAECGFLHLLLAAKEEEAARRAARGAPTVNSDEDDEDRVG